jgi:hypothetical protein
MEKIILVLDLCNRKSNIFKSIIHLQNIQALASLECVPIPSPQAKGTWTNLTKTHLKFEGFINQMHLVIWFYPPCYPKWLNLVELINKSLLSIALMWFVPLLDHKFPFLNNFEAFVETFFCHFWRFRQKTHINKQVAIIWV